MDGKALLCSTYRHTFSRGAEGKGCGLRWVQKIKSQSQNVQVVKKLILVDRRTRCETGKHHLKDHEAGSRYTLSANMRCYSNPSQQEVGYDEIWWDFTLLVIPCDRSNFFPFYLCRQWTDLPFQRMWVNIQSSTTALKERSGVNDVLSGRVSAVTN